MFLGLINISTVSASGKVALWLLLSPIIACVHFSLSVMFQHSYMFLVHVGTALISFLARRAVFPIHVAIHFKNVDDTNANN